jgi:uncharacterized protein YbjQ (UPF0145 family)
MLLTSQTRVVGQGEVKRLGSVTGEYTIDEKIYKAILTEMKDYEEIRTPAYEKELEKAKQTVMDEMTKKAKELGANAIIGLNMYHELVNFGRMMMIAGKGTAAYIEGLEDM